MISEADAKFLSDSGAISTYSAPLESAFVVELSSVILCVQKWLLRGRSSPRPALADGSAWSDWLDTELARRWARMRSIGLSSGQTVCWKADRPTASWRKERCWPRLGRLPLERLDGFRKPLPNASISICSLSRARAARRRRRAVRAASRSGSKSVNVARKGS